MTRMLSLSSGIAVLLVTLGFGGHLMHHVFVEISHQALRTPAIWMFMLAGLVVWTLSCIGGCLLLKGNR
jgi:hypothetical protein